MIGQTDILKLKGSPEQLSSFLSKATSKEAARLLDRLGRLPSDFNRHPLLQMLQHSDSKLRALTVKNLAKLSDLSLVPTYLDIIKQDTSSSVRREAVSAIGRLRSTKTMPVLINLLNDSDPEIVLQALRGLLVFRGHPVVEGVLVKLRNHPNEMVQEVVSRELQQSKNMSIAPPHTQFPVCMDNAVVAADVRDVLTHIPDQSVHLTFTSPPYYNARDYSTYKSYKEYLDFLEDVFQGVHRITKEGRFLVLNTSPIIIPRVSRSHASKRYPIPYDIHSRLVGMGWEFIDDIVWLKPEASVKNRNAGFLQHRKPLAYKPNAVTEMLMVYRKKTDKLIDWNIHQYDHRVVNRSRINGDYETTNVWRIDPTFNKTHSAVFPKALCDRVIKFYSYEGDLIFDPFAGSGTLGYSAMSLHRSFFLVEKEQLYIDKMRENFNKSELFQLDSPVRFYTIEGFKKAIDE